MNKYIIELILLIISFCIYFIWYSIYITSSKYDINSVSNLELGLGVFGFICGLWLSSYLQRTIFKDKVDNTKRGNIYEEVIEKLEDYFGIVPFVYGHLPSSIVKM